LVVEELLKRWVAACEDFRARERRELIEREPSQATLEKFRQELKWLLRSGRHLLPLASDPDFPVAKCAEQIEWRLRQLDDSWKTLNNPMTQDEADALLHKHFPDDPLALRLLRK